MHNRTRISSIVFTVYIFLSFYAFGGGIVNSLVGYKTWRAVGAEEFPAFHQIDSALIIPLFVIPLFLSYIHKYYYFGFVREVFLKAWFGLQWF